MYVRLCYEEKIVLHCLNSLLVSEIWWGYQVDLLRLKNILFAEKQL